MEYQYIEPIQLSGYEIPAEIQESTPIDDPTLFVGYTLQGEQTSIGANLPVSQLFDNRDLNLYAVFMFDHGVDYSAALTVDVYDHALFEASVGPGVAYVDERLKPSLNLNTALELAPSHRMILNSFYDFDKVYVTTGYEYSF